MEAIYRQRYLFAAAFSTGVMMPIGYEFGFRRKLDVVTTRPTDWEEPLFDLTEFIADANAMKRDAPPLNEEGPQIWWHPRDSGVVALVRRAVGDGWALTLVNPDRAHGHTVSA